MQRRLFFGLALVLPGVLFAMVTLGAQAQVTGATPTALPSFGGTADLAIISHTDSPDPVVGTNTVQYRIVVKNNGPDAAGVSLDISQNGFSSDSFHAATLSGGDIVSVEGQGWSCSIAETPDSATCTRNELDAGETAPPVFVEVVAPDFDTVITNSVSVSSTSGFDPNPDNDSSSEDTTVTVDNECASGVVSCGTGHIDYGRDSVVTTGALPNPVEYLVGTAFFNAVPGATGGQTWSMHAPKKSTCIGLIGCTFAMVTDAWPSLYRRGDITLKLVCHSSRCPLAPIAGAGVVMIKFDALGIPHVLPRCTSLLKLQCFKTSKDSFGNLVVLIKNISAGDPRYAGICIGKC